MKNIAGERSQNAPKGPANKRSGNNFTDGIAGTAPLDFYRGQAHFFSMLLIKIPHTNPTPDLYESRKRISRLSPVIIFPRKRQCILIILENNIPTRIVNGK